MPTSAEERLARVLSDQGNIYRRLLSDVFAGLLLEIGLLAIILADTWVGPELWNLATTPGSLGAFATILVALGGGLLALAPAFGVFANAAGWFLMDSGAHRLIRALLVSYSNSVNTAKPRGKARISRWWMEDLVGANYSDPSFSIVLQISHDNRRLARYIILRYFPERFLYIERYNAIHIFMRSVGLVSLLLGLAHLWLSNLEGFALTLVLAILWLAFWLLCTLVAGFERVRTASTIYGLLVETGLKVPSGNVTRDEVRAVLEKLARKLAIQRLSAR